jgi:hypothetical protein
MPRVTHVKKAQQRYATVAVRDAEGNPVRTPVMGRNGEQERSKRGLTFMTKTVADKTRPLPLLTCDHCRKDIEIGTPYKHISPKSGPYGGHQLNRHESCPTWQVWEYSSSMSARIAQIENDYTTAIDGAEEGDTISDALSAMAEQVRELAEEKRESASNIEEGFGHPTSASEELEQTADDLESWADEIEQSDVPDVSDYTGCEVEDCEEGEIECPECSGTGQVDPEDPEATEQVDCDECNASGKVSCDDCSGEGDDYFRLDDWREAVDSEVTAPFECPV